MIEAVRWTFLTLYVLGLLAVVVTSALHAPRRRLIELRPATPWAAFVPLGAVAYWLLPPLLIGLRIGEVDASWLALRLAGLALGVFAALLLLWAASCLGRYLVPFGAIFRDHDLVRRGPFRFVRHPVYGANLTLLMGAALGTLNLSLFLVWPVALVGFVRLARAEDRLLAARFDSDWHRYAEVTGLLLPRLVSLRPQTLDAVDRNVD